MAHPSASRFSSSVSGQHDELDEQFDTSAGQMHAYGSLTSHYGTITPRAIGTSVCNADSMRPIPRQKSNSILAGSSGLP